MGMGVPLSKRRGGWGDGWSYFGEGVGVCHGTRFSVTPYAKNDPFPGTGMQRLHNHYPTVGSPPHHAGGGTTVYTTTIGARVIFTYIRFRSIFVHCGTSPVSVAKCSRFERVLSGIMIAVQPANHRVMRSGLNSGSDFRIRSG